MTLKEMLDEMERKAKAATPGPYVCDIRTGCWAIYAGEERNCLSGASSDSVAYQNGSGEESQPGGYRLITPEQAANAQFIASLSPSRVLALIACARLLNIVVTELDCKHSEWGKKSIAALARLSEEGR